ncbi:MAG: hypothetical protein Q8927_00940 [Bacteroidota bacterium]|nr:hypothetical protein [Bacteroidota bacterium]MDP4214733.1 hypothetical protein [Bacteroidota bacterium]MDP4248149.1 hypothetical protein [Bacteroidota bacterium]MDP4253288.1 hypothetical protein [Bacteroidota bacterium]
MNSVSLAVVHPSFERLKRSGKWLHLAAGLLILTHALSHAHRTESSPVYFWCQLIISIDILILVLAGRDALVQLPVVNLFFRVVEIAFFLGIGLLMLLEGKTGIGVVHLCLSMAYSYLFYCERNLRSEELLSFHHTGVTIPGLPENRWFLWADINSVEVHYDSIHIRTSGRADLHFELRRNLEFAELDQIHEFCRHYLGR